MSDAFRIQCSCGCENWVTPQQRGLFIHCTACGTRMLAIDKSAPPATSPITQAAILANIPKRRINRSPFEPEEVVPGDDADLPIPDRLDNLHRREIEARSAFIKSADVRDHFADESCAKCGRPLRGEWDRLESASGIVCYVCSNQATEGIPERLRFVESAPERGRLRPRIDINLPPTWRNPRWERFKRIGLMAFLGLMSLSVFLMTAYVSFFELGGGEPSPSPIVITAQDLEDLSIGLWLIARTWLVLSEFLPIVVALYLVRYFSGSFVGRNPLAHAGEVIVTCLPYLLVQLLTVALEFLVVGRPSGLILFVFFSLSMLKLWALLSVAMDSFVDDWMESITFVTVLWTITLFAMPFLNRLLFHSLGVI